MQDYIHQLIKAGESETLDFKQTVTAAKIARTLVAFANAKGGIILIGVSDDKRILGIDPPEELFVIEQASEKYCSPPIKFNYEIYEEENKAVLLIEIAESTQKPHFAINNDHQLHIYMRVGNKNHSL
jgi:predicted HTH transcriptional regulator